MKVFLVILVAFALSVSAFGNDARLVEDGLTGDDDSTNEPIITTTTKADVTATPSVPTVVPTTTPEVTTQPPRPIEKPTVPNDIQDIVDNIISEDTSGSQNSNTNEKNTIIQPPITVNKETTDYFIEKVKEAEAEAEVTFPEVTTKPDSIKTKPAQAKLDSYEFPKKTTYLGVDLGQMKDIPTLKGTFGSSEETTSITVSSTSSTSAAVSMNIIDGVEDAYMANTEINIYVGKSSTGGRRLADSPEEAIEITKCGAIKNIKNSTLENVKINLYGNVIIKCTNNFNGLIANEITESHLINVRLEFMNANSRIVSIQAAPGTTTGLIAGKITNSTVFYTRVIGDILHVTSQGKQNEGEGGNGGNGGNGGGNDQPAEGGGEVEKPAEDGNVKSVRSLSDDVPVVDVDDSVIVSSLFGEVDSTDIINSYVDINNILISSDTIIYGGIAGRYTPGIPPISRFNDNNNNNDNDDGEKLVDSIPVIINNTFVVTRKGFTISSDVDKVATISGFIGQVKKSDKMAVIESCYVSTVVNGLDHPKLTFAGLIGENNDKVKFNITYSYIVMSIKSSYLHDEGKVFAFVKGEEEEEAKGEEEEGKEDQLKSIINYNRCYAYISSPFIINRTEENMLGNFTYYYIKLDGYNKTNILVRSLQQQQSKDAIIYGNGADITAKNYEQSEKAKETLKQQGFKVNPYNPDIPINNAPGTTNQGGLYLPISSSEVWGGGDISFSPEARGDINKKIDYKLLPNPLSTRKVCPNNCGGNGRCYNGICYCNEGYNGIYCQYKTCPYGYMFSDPTIYNDTSKGRALECSNQGYCNKDTGFCECFNGFEGNACQRKQCPNQCSNHGICSTINKVISNNNMVDIDMEYNRNYRSHDGSIVQICVCDKEYEGYDCSLRKCPVGYSQMSECDAEPQSIINIKFTEDPSAVGKNIYLKYTDPIGKVWYTIGFDYAKREEWIKGLTSLPSGTISIDNVDEIEKGKKYQITYSKHQTGRQVPIEVLTLDEIKELSKKYPFITVDNALEIGEGNNKVEISYESSIPPIPCSGNGICDSTKGLCNCFSGFYGLSCSSHSSVL